MEHTLIVKIVYHKKYVLYLHNTNSKIFDIGSGDWFKISATFSTDF